MRRLMVLLCLVASAGVCTPSVDGGDWANRAWHGFWAGYYRNKHWPEPFQTLDRQAVMHPMELMKNNGWRLHNTLGDHLFLPETNQLTNAARMKVHWVATQAPTTRRTVFVYGSENDPNTQARVASVQNYLNHLYPDGDAPSVLVTHVIPRGASGDIYSGVINGFRNSQPAPVLPSNAAGAGEAQ